MIFNQYSRVEGENWEQKRVGRGIYLRAGSGKREQKSKRHSSVIYNRLSPSQKPLPSKVFFFHLTSTEA